MSMSVLAQKFLTEDYYHRERMWKVQSYPNREVVFLWLVTPLHGSWRSALPEIIDCLKNPAT